jgi:hypothetical protein
MSITIHDGNPWYLSPDIWTVPGSDPNGSAAIPAAGEATYVWCRVENSGPDQVRDVVVDFYWADPSTVITRTSAHRIGRSFATLDPGSADVLCVSPWAPSWVNDGHVCLVVEISDAGPPAATSVPFDPPNDPHVAQRNLTLVSMRPGGRMAMVFSAGGSGRGGKLIARRGKLAQLRNAAKLAGLTGELAEAGEVEFGLLGPEEDRCSPGDLHRERKVKEPQAAVLHVTGEIGPDEGAVILIEEHDDERVVGGLAVLAVHEDSANRRSAE